MSETLYERYGVVKATHIISAFYQSVIKSPTLAHYFDGLDMGGLIEHQTAFMSTVMGGPASFTPDQLVDSHAPLGLTEADFDEMIVLLTQALDRSDITPADTAALLDQYRSYRPHLLATANGG